MSNDTEFGLASYCRPTCPRVPRRRATGVRMVGINTGLDLQRSGAVRRHVKASGLGREGSSTGSRTTSRSSTSPGRYLSPARNASEADLQQELPSGVDVAGGGTGRTGRRVADREAA